MTEEEIFQLVYSLIRVITIITMSILSYMDCIKKKNHEHI
jgi:hypothetical protein